MAGPLLIDLSHTSHTRARTGVQRTALALRRELGAHALPVCRDPYERAWRPLDRWELLNLAAATPGTGRKAQWPLAARLRGLLRRWRSRPNPLDVATAGAPPWGFLEPEIFSPAVAGALDAAVPPGRGPRVAIFHDAIVLKYPEMSPPATVARFPAYLRELLSFDGIAANSADSRDTLVSYWRWLGAANPPPVAALPLGIDPAAAPVAALSAPADPAEFAAPSPPAPGRAVSAGLPVVLCVGTLEGRKNHVSLLEACERLWEQGSRFELRLIGSYHAGTGRAALERVRAVQEAGRPLRYDGPASEEALNAAYASCAFTVYPSVAEGFGLPVAESLARGKPCICSARGALGEISAGGGCLTLEEVTPEALAEAIGRLLSSPRELAALAIAARARTFRTWSDYSRALTDWMATLRLTSHALPR